MSRNPVGPGDVLRAIAAIAPDSPTRWPAIAVTLGFAFPDASTTARGKPSADQSQSTAAVSRPRAIEMEAAVGPSEATLPVLEPVESRSSSDAPRFLGHVAELPRETTVAVPGPAIDPLLSPSTAPSMLRAAVVVPEQKGQLDIERTVDLVASRQTLDRLPRRRIWRPAQDVIVLQDLGAGMDAFTEDVGQLVTALQRVAGRDTVRLGGFVGRPAAALAELGLQHGGKVLVLTDLGLSRLAGADELGPQRWIEFADLVAKAAARAALLVPLSSDRWPAAIASRLSIVTWDRTTTVAQVFRAVRDRG